jgi:hypothetical protein
MPAKVPALWLSRQVSNLNSSDPESDVLPITPRDNFEVANIKKILKITVPDLFSSIKKTHSEVSVRFLFYQCCTIL